MKSALAFIAVLLCGGLILGDDRVQAPSEFNIREFHQAIADGDQHTVSEMLEVYPDLLEAPDPNSRDQLTPLAMAVKSGHKNVAALLIKQGADVESGRPGNTPMYIAAQYGQSDILAMLLDAGADINGGSNANDVSACPPIRAALMEGYVGTARLMVERGARVDIYSAAGLGWTNWIARQIRDHPEQAGIKDHWRFSPLTYACACGCAGTANELLSHGATVDVDDPDPTDRGTHLDIAVIDGWVDLAIVLMAHGADVNAQNTAGQTPLDFAVKARQEEIIQLIKERGGKSGTGH